MLKNSILFILSVLLSIWWIYLIKKLFYKINLLDNPKKYWHKRDPIPHSVWIILFILFFILSVIFVPFSQKLMLLRIFWFIISLMSFVDDFFFLSPKLRLLIQLIVWFIIWLTSIKIGYVQNIFWWIINLDFLHFTFFWTEIYLISTIFTMIWYVFIFNALNWTDWITWNTAWVSIISYLVLGLLWVKLYLSDDLTALKSNSVFIIQICTILVWILIPFWFGNVREKYLMWDSWTMFLWFMLASLSIISGGKIATVLVVFWIYTVDAFYVVIKRILRKQSPLKWDLTHLHHRLIDAWFTRIQTLVYIYTFSLIFWISSLFVGKTWKIIIFLFIVVFVVVNPILFFKKEKWNH